MKKYLNEESESVISARINPVSSTAKEGDTVPHNQIVNNIEMYAMNGDCSYFKVWLSRDQILSIAKQIAEIETTEIMSKVSNSPF